MFPSFCKSHNFNWHVWATSNRLTHDAQCKWYETHPRAQTRKFKNRNHSKTKNGTRKLKAQYIKKKKSRSRMRCDNSNDSDIDFQCANKQHNINSKRHVSSSLLNFFYCFFFVTQVCCLLLLLLLIHVAFSRNTASKMKKKKTHRNYNTNTSLSDYNYRLCFGFIGSPIKKKPNLHHMTCKRFAFSLVLWCVCVKWMCLQTTGHVLIWLLHLTVPSSKHFFNRA